MGAKANLSNLVHPTINWELCANFKLLNANKQISLGKTIKQQAQSSATIKSTRIDQAASR